jgi:hypothetical protein
LLDSSFDTGSSIPLSKAVVLWKRYVLKLLGLPKKK